MHDLTRGMHTGIGTSCTDDFDRLVSDFTERLFNVRLYAIAGTLALPAIVRGPVVFNAERDSQSGLLLRSGRERIQKLLSLLTLRIVAFIQDFVEN